MKKFKLSKEFLKFVCTYIDSQDYSSYTFQYPPVFVRKTSFLDNEFIEDLNKLTNINHLYIHIPFCETKCTFCRYFSYISNENNLYQQYINSILREISLYQQYINFKLKTLYIGGGTPSILSPKQLDYFLSYLFSYFIIIPDFQFVFESSASTLTFEKIDILAKFNCNRLTIGIQSFNEDVLKLSNRPVFNINRVRQLINYAQQKGIKINIDLMIGIVGQNQKILMTDLLKTIELGPDIVHLNYYSPTSFTIDGYVSNKDINFYIYNLFSNKVLKKHHYYSIEGDAYVKYKKVNLVNKQLFAAMKGEDFLGVGISAVGNTSLFNYINTNLLKEYLNLLRFKKFPIKYRVRKNKYDSMIQEIIYTIRYGKLDMGYISKKYNINFIDFFSSRLFFLKKEKVIHIEDNNIYFSFDTIEDYNIYSKAFFDDDILSSLYKKFIRL